MGKNKNQIILKKIFQNIFLKTKKKILKKIVQKFKKITQKNHKIIHNIFIYLHFQPLYTINCVNAFCHDCMVNQTVLYFAIILSHFNSAVNPLLYAYHLKDFRGALSRLFHCTSQPDSFYRPSLISQHQQRINEHFASTRRNFEPRVYVDSPVWKRQQIQPKNGKNIDEPKKATTTDNDSGLNVSSSDLRNENGNEKNLSNTLADSITQENIFIISDSGMEMGITYEQQNSSLYTIVKRNREKSEDSI